MVFLCTVARARVRPRESSPTMHGVLVHRGARPRESSPTMDGVCRVCVSHVSGVCQPARNQKSAASPKRKIRHQPETKMGHPPLPATLVAKMVRGIVFP